MANIDNSNDILPSQMIWKRNSPYLYQLLYSCQLDWPSLTIQWLPSLDSSIDKKNNQLYTVNQIILGTNTSNQQQNYLMIGKIRVPNQQNIRIKFQQNKLNKTQTIKKNDNLMEQKVQILHKIPHQGQVNRAKYNPLEQNLIATRTPLGPIHIYNTYHLKRQLTTPQVILIGHDTEGYAIQWNPKKAGYLIAGSYDGSLSMWDLNSKSSGNNKIQSSCSFTYHQQQIQDLSFNKFHDSIFTSCDDGGNIAFWDVRFNKLIYHEKYHDGTIYSLQFSPKDQNYLASGGTDGLIKIWDLRNSKDPLYTMRQSSNQVTQVKWSHDQINYIWSVCDRKITMWDISQQTAKFIHGGHRNQIYQMDVCHNQPDTVASVDANNEIQIFQPNQNCKL